MKIFFISDIHGSLFFLKKALKRYREEGASYIVMLGDALYHGPRNPLPEEYKPQEVANLLNEYKDKIIAVRGNCDSEVDQMLIEYPMMADYSIILYNNRRLFLTHGHIYNEDNMPNLSENDVLVHGHTHLPVAKKHNRIYVLNPGSLSLPKENNPNSYAILQDDLFQIKDLEGTVIKEIKL
ncbi:MULTISPECIES: phosphodiesterase [Clostridium]|uniref:phosphodiesterase n=1 Tax=Clostridium TaxID=1485 RepID=UPI0013E90835|nr:MULTISPECIES: phosphodiesterase [Clostridium]MBW9159161.1 phosphodiesterase [Clostridium tagluense]MBZ9623622.1 phosphodiesterase [Clostridium sp. FP2]MBZ9635047.1 phosphodiesterase [Clostridium sp. FP1]MCB2299014.1 phosphodiesterase [Clostridium tagluense]WLC67778.1 phosphodiesterase [Clostridium tagluense]